MDGFAIAVMEEMGIDISRHAAKTFDDLQDDLFDIVVTLSPEAHHRALELTRTSPVEVEFWNTFDPAWWREAANSGSTPTARCATGFSSGSATGSRRR